MSYVLNLSAAVEQQILSHPEPLRQFILLSLERLAQRPTSFRSRTSVRGQLAEFKFDRAGISLWLTVTFFYGQDEQTLHIEEIAIEFGE